MSDHSTTPSAESLAQMPPAEAAEFLGNQDSETIHEMLVSMPTQEALLIASQLPGTASAQDAAAGDAIDSIDAPIETLMVEPKGLLSPETTVAGALDHLVHTQPVTGITYLYVVDADTRLVGVVAMRDLLLARPGQTLADIMTPEPFAFSTDTPVSEAVHAALARRHRLYPVIDAEGRMVGVVYGWRLFEYVATEISGQSGVMVGVDREERVSTGVFKAFRMRHPWLQVNLFTAFAAALVVGLFEDTIAQIVVLAAFLPVLAGQSGNTGCQALAITLRGLTLGELVNFPTRKLLQKEIALGAMNGFCVGVVAAGAMWVYAGMTGTAQPMVLALVVLVAMIGACAGSGIFGVLVPLTLRRFGADPAMASSIFLTTFTDILGMGLMLFLATSLLL